MGTEPGAAAPAEIVRLQAGDLPRLQRLLSDNSLPADDCAADGNEFYGIFDRHRLVAAGGLETAGNYRLLRSLVVASEYRGQGLGRRVYDFLLTRARDSGCIAVYLLTETAADYFTRLGFVAVARAAVPAEIAATRQFADLCPDSAVCLTLPLADG